MTTEIAVLNRLGVALAADSAVTISGGGTTKIFDSADKLFELSAVFPVALMLNGNMDCFGFPWEILIKDFRADRGALSNKSIDEWASEFISFVDLKLAVDSSIAENYVRQIVRDEFSRIRRTVFERAWAEADRYPGKKPFEVFIIVLNDVLSNRMASISGEAMAESLSNFSDDELLSAYGGIFKDAMNQIFENFELGDDIILEASKLAILVLRALANSEFSTGLIVAGYGAGADYPSVASIDVDGYILGKLKYSKVQERAKITRPDLGYAVSFAQTDVIERLLSGADPRFVNKTADFLTETVEGLIPLVADLYAKKARRPRRQREETKIREILSTIGDQYRKDTAPAFRVEFREEFERMIALMPKLELIELAEALISITAIERKATADEGTVGGPIDVAFITKHEGFVWIKRKHYFNPHLNPRYFWRKYHHVDTGVSP